MEGFFMAQINEKRLVKYLINILQHLIKLMRFYLYLLGASSGVSLWSFATVISAPVGITSGSISLVFLVSNGILKTFLETTGKKRNKRFACKIVRKIVLLAMTKLDSKEKIISKALADTDITHEEFALVTHETENFT